MTIVSAAPVKYTCPNCGGKNIGYGHIGINTHIIWRNSHGEKLRFFCKRCGQWTDVTMKRNAPFATYVVVKKPEKTRLEASVNAPLQRLLDELKTLENELLEMWGNAHDEIERREREQRFRGVQEAYFIAKTIVDEIDQYTRDVELHEKPKDKPNTVR
jgi:hypothetical protein